VSEAIVAFGGNLGRPDETFARALEVLRRSDGVDVVAVSSLYRSAPWGPVAQPDFLNGVAVCETPPSVSEFAAVLFDIERAHGRGHAVRFGPRELDLDLVAFGDEILNGPDLTVPHPRMTERTFVLEPLREVRPTWVHPGLQRGVRELLADLRGSGDDTPCERLRGSRLGTPLAGNACRN